MLQFHLIPFTLHISLNSLDRKGVRLLSPRDSQITSKPDAGTDDTAPGDSNELKWEFDDDRYYEFMCFDVPKVVRSPEYDHGHDEESQNGRDIKIDILDDYIRTQEVFRRSFG